MKTEKWYQRRLAAYFTEHYTQYEDTTEFWNDPAMNQWLFDIPELNERIELTCYDDGRVTRSVFPIKKKGEYS